MDNAAATANPPYMTPRTTAQRVRNNEIAAIKMAMHKGWLAGLEEQLDLERDLQRDLGRSGDYREGVAAFMEKRRPNFSGR